MRVSERIKAIMKWKNISVSEFSHIIGQSEKSVYNYTGGKNDPTLSVIEKIYKFFPDIKAEWLLTGEGEMLSEPLASEPTHIYINGDVSNQNHGIIAGSQVQKIGDTDCMEKLATAIIEIGYLKQQIADKEEIIRLMKNI